MRSQRVRVTRTRAVVAGMLACALVITAAPPARAQSVTAGSIRGKVADETGGALPGVTVNVTSPALQSTRSDVSDAEGNYRLTDLPVGEYRMTFELGGFQQFVREGIALSASFVATVNVTLKVGSLEESVTVSGESVSSFRVRLTPSTAIEAFGAR